MTTFWIEVPNPRETKIETRDPLGIARTQNFMFKGPDIEVSDGYHTMHELYEHRMALFCALCNLMHNWVDDKDESEFAWKSKLHSDGTMFEGGYFIAGIETPNGQITYHMKIEKWWDRFRVPELERAPQYDGHKSNDVIERLLKL